ncbi:MAG: epoxyqueuosine reductase QueH [Candidatus Omnitrophota bacterium]
MKILLHICCAVCAGSCVYRLREEGYEVQGLFYNPNIQPPSEYLKRLQATEELARQEKFLLFIGDYDLHNWYNRVEGLEKEPEGARRCAECFRLRLQKTQEIAKEKDIPVFTTTLTLSPHKDALKINQIGQSIGKDAFLARDFKKQDGVKKSAQLAKEYCLYRQNYCGCIYSRGQAYLSPI